jgi:hypothetical protein
MGDAWTPVGGVPLDRSVETGINLEHLSSCKDSQKDRKQEESAHLIPFPETSSGFGRKPPYVVIEFGLACRFYLFGGGPS